MIVIIWKLLLSINSKTKIYTKNKNYEKANLKKIRRRWVVCNKNEINFFRSRKNISKIFKNKIFNKHSQIILIKKFINYRNNNKNKIIINNKNCKLQYKMKTQVLNNWKISMHLINKIINLKMKNYKNNIKEIVVLMIKIVKF